VGTWTDLGATGVASDPSKSYNAIDPNLIRDDGGNYFLTFGSFWGDIQRVRMTPTKVNGDVYQVAYDPNDTAMEGAYVFKYGSYYYLFYSKGQCCGYDTNKPAAGKEYKIMVCRSTSAVGPFVDKNGVSCRNGGGTVVLESHDWVYGPGGQGVYQDPTHGPVSYLRQISPLLVGLRADGMFCLRLFQVLYYHYVDTRIGYADGQKQFGWNTIDFSSGWPVV
jgi:arabinan endo-1,5-alpha-L-arabinosidase